MIVENDIWSSMGQFIFNYYSLTGLLQFDVGIFF